MLQLELALLVGGCFVGGYLVGLWSAAQHEVEMSEQKARRIRNIKKLQELRRN